MEKQAVQLIRGQRYNAGGRMFLRGVTQMVSPQAAKYLLERRNPLGQRFFARVKINRIKAPEPPILDEEIEDLDVETDPVITETVAVGDDGSQTVVNSVREDLAIEEDGLGNDLMEEVRADLGRNRKVQAEPLTHAQREALLGDPHIEDTDDQVAEV